MGDIFKDSFIEVELTSPAEFRRYKFIKVCKIIDSKYGYFIHCRRSQKNYYGYLTHFGTRLYLRYELNVETSQFRGIGIKDSCCKLIQCNVYVAEIQPNVYPTLSDRCNSEYLISYMKYQNYKYKIYRCDQKYWEEYCQELNEEINKNKNYPIKKISHMREITDLIVSFL